MSCASSKGTKSQSSEAISCGSRISEIRKDQGNQAVYLQVFIGLVAFAAMGYSISYAASYITETWNLAPEQDQWGHIPLNLFHLTNSQWNGIGLCVASLACGGLGVYSMIVARDTHRTRKGSWFELDAETFDDNIRNASLEVATDFYYDNYSGSTFPATPHYPRWGMRKQGNLDHLVATGDISLKLRDDLERCMAQCQESRCDFYQAQQDKKDLERFQKLSHQERISDFTGSSRLPECLDDEDNRALVEDIARIERRLADIRGEVIGDQEVIIKDQHGHEAYRYQRVPRTYDDARLPIRSQKMVQKDLVQTIAQLDQVNGQLTEVKRLIVSPSQQKTRQAREKQLEAHQEGLQRQIEELSEEQRKLTAEETLLAAEFRIKTGLMRNLIDNKLGECDARMREAETRIALVKIHWGKIDKNTSYPGETREMRQLP